jgi:hypothetical protein
VRNATSLLSLSSYRLPQLTEFNAHYHALTQSGPLASHQHSRARQLWVMAQAMIVPLAPLKREMALPENDCFWARRLVRGGVPLPN